MEPGARSPLIMLERVRVVTLSDSYYNGKVLTPIRVLHTVQAIGVEAGTQITFPTEPTSPFTTEVVYKAPTTPKVIVNFHREKGLQTPPFRATMRGTIQNVRGPESTTKGEMKMGFDLIDAEGWAIPVVALGRNADNPNIIAGTEVIVYHGSGRGPLGSIPGCVYLFKDALIVPLGLRSACTAKVCRISIGKA